MPTTSLTPSLSGGDLIIADTDALGRNSNLTAIVSGSEVVITDTAEEFSGTGGIAGASLSNGDKTLTVPLATFAGNLIVDGAGGNDLLTVDFSGGSFSRTITFSGGQGSNALTIRGGSQGTATYNDSNASAGSVILSNFGTIIYTGSGTITNTGIASDVIINLPTGPSSVALSDDGIPGNGLFSLSGGSFETKIFVEPAGSLTINRGNAADTVAVNALPDLTASMTIGALAAPFAQITIAGPVSLAANNALVFAAQSIAVNGSVTTSGGDVTLLAKHGITLSSSITTGGGALTANADCDGDGIGTMTLEAAGSLDPTFGIGGKVTTDFGSSTDIAYSMALQADGKIVVVGDSYIQGHDFVLARYNSDGSLDASFGVGGKVATSFGSSQAQANSVVLQADGKIVVTGWLVSGNNDFALARYNSNGSLDPSFGVGGKVTTSIGLFSDIANSALLQADGKIVVAGRSFNGSNFDFALARYNSNGSLDPSFDGDGKVTTDFGSSTDIAYSMALQANGKIVVAGYRNGSKNDFALACYNSNGSLDAGFGIGGTLTTSFGASSDIAYSVAVEADGKIFVAGVTNNGANNDFALACYNSIGSLDSSFGIGGKVTTAFGSSDDNPFSTTLLADGKIVVSGYSYNGSNFDFAVVRYNGNGSLDPTFGVGGKLTTDFGSSNDIAAGMALQADGKIAVVGYSYNGSNYDFAIVRYQTNGSISTGEGAIVIVAADAVLLGPVSSSGVVSIVASQVNRPIDLGSNAAGSLGLTDAELDRVTAATLQIGNASNGTLTVSSPITRPASTDMMLASNADIDISDGQINTAGGPLALMPGAAGSVRPNANDVDVMTSAGAALSFAVGTHLAIAIDGPTVDTQYRQLNVAGKIDLTGVDLVLSGSYLPLIGNSFIVVANDGSDPIIGTFNGLLEGTAFVWGGARLSITYAGGTSNNDVVLTVANPIVTSVAPFVGPTTGGIIVVINGANFLGVAGPTGVKFGDSNATGYTVDSATQITAVLPMGVAGVVNVVVTNLGIASPTVGSADDFQFIATPPPQVLSVTVNGNLPALVGPQRSRVVSLVVVFDQPVQLDAGAFSLLTQNHNIVYGGASQSSFGSSPQNLVTSSGDNFTWVVTFSGNTEDGFDGLHSLRDGVYDFNIDAAKVHLVGLPSVNAAAFPTTVFHRLFGEVTGQELPQLGNQHVAIVAISDNFGFRSSFNSFPNYRAYFDFDGDGVIGVQDNFQFRSRFNRPLTWSA